MRRKWRQAWMARVLGVPLMVVLSGALRRERKLNGMMLLRSMIIAASTGAGGRQADAMKLYFEGGARPR